MKRNNVPSCIGGEGMKERIHLYEPFFHHYYIDEILNDYELETLIRVKKDDYQQSIAYIKLISIYSHHASIDELQQQVDSIQMMMETYEDYHEFEQYLIENEEHQVIGIDLCALTYNHHYDELDLEELTPDQYYQVGLYYYDQKKYDQALECFHLGEECEDSDCLCVLGYMYEKGQGVKQSNQVAMTYYRLASDLGNVVASCNLAYFYEYGIDVDQDYEKAFELSDSLNSAQEDIAVGEFATILGMEHLNLENKELIQKNQEIQLETRWRIIILLCIIVVIVGIMFFRETRLNKVLRRAKDAEQSASRMKTEFIQNMSHEIRTPLNSIVGFSQILSSKISEEDEESKEYTTIIEQGSNHLLQLVDDVLELSSLDSGTTIPIDTKSELNELCLQWMERAKRLVKPGVVLSYQPEQNELYLYTNPARLGQVVLQLLHNAAKFTEEGGITLSWRILPKQKQIMICITDTGIGIPQDKQEFVFERFAKLDTFSKGTGLGLALSRLIMERMGGNLVLDAQYMDGCRFILTLPI